jgi:subtilisin family serine protease
MSRRHTRRGVSALVLSGALVVLAACTDSPTSPAPETRLTPGAPSRSVSTGTVVPRVIVVFADTAGIPQAGLNLIASLGGAVAHRYDAIGVATVNGLSAAAVTQLRASSLVAAVSFDRIVNWLPHIRAVGAIAADAVAVPHADPTQTRYYADGTQWNMRVIQADKAWNAGYFGNATTRVAIVDTGIDYGNRELTGIVDIAASRAFSQLIVEEAGQSVVVPVEPQQPGDSAFMDNHFHGTHVASTVASNLRSLAAVAPHVTLIAVKVLNFQGSGTFESVAAGILYASGQAHAHVINMSLGAEVDQTEDGVPALLTFMQRAISQAEKQGTIVISAAGNSGLNLDVGTVVATPCEESTICVSATGPINQQGFDQPATYSNYGITAIDVAAPGGNVPADSSQSGVNQDLVIGACSRRASEPGLAPCRTSVDGVSYFYAYAAGTSMATPHVSGVAAQIRSQNPTLSVSGIRTKILSSADDIGTKGKDVYSNWGRINLRKALGL